MNEYSSRVVALKPENIDRLAVLSGPLDSNFKQIEDYLDVCIEPRGGNCFQISGPPLAVQRTSRLLKYLYREVGNGTGLTPHYIHLALQQAHLEQLGEFGDDRHQSVHTKKRGLKTRGAGQYAYIEAIRRHDINFAIGPSGTGKTHLAVACAVEALENRRVERILLVRPAVEAGEKLGFLPGDLSQKVDPYLRPMHDSLLELMDSGKVNRLIDRRVIEAMPLAYMRGRTLNKAFVILDEAQNTSAEQMKMFLTRIGFGTTVVITGDITQTDLPKGQRSGLRQALRILSGVKGISFTHLTAQDIVRHALVKEIVQAYDRFERQEHLTNGSRA